MSNAGDTSALASEIEQTRQHLAGTIDQLLYRASPKTIVGRQVASAKAFFVDPETGAPRTGNIAAVAGGVIGVVAVVVVLRRVVADD